MRPTSEWNLGWVPRDRRSNRPARSRRRRRSSHSSHSEMINHHDVRDSHARSRRIDLSFPLTCYPLTYTHLHTTHPSFRRICQVVLARSMQVVHGHSHNRRPLPSADDERAMFSAKEAWAKQRDVRCHGQTSSSLQECYDHVTDPFFKS